MNTSKHTPGPWHISTTRSRETSVADSRGINLCVLGDASLFDTLAPDANLIAAAPAMYEALKAIVGQQPPNRWGYDSADIALDDEWRAQARAALAQAEGKP